MEREQLSGHIQNFMQVYYCRCRKVQDYLQESILVLYECY